MELWEGGILNREYIVTPNMMTTLGLKYGDMDYIYGNDGTMWGAM